MRVVLQRVSKASVTVDGSVVGEIGAGFLVLLGVAEGDTEDDLEWLARKTTRMRVFADEDDRMNRSLLDLNGEALVVSQFTLHASTRKGNRPSFIGAAAPADAEALYEKFADQLQSELGEGKVARGQFGADMKVDLLNDGPVTIIVDSRLRE